MQAPNVIPVPVVKSVDELAAVAIDPTRQTLVYVRLGDLLDWATVREDKSKAAVGVLNSYSNNRGIGKSSEKTIKKVRNEFRSCSFSTVTAAVETGVTAERVLESSKEKLEIFPGNEEDGATCSIVTLADGHSRITGAQLRRADKNLSRVDQEKLVAVQLITQSEFMSTYGDLNSADAHKDSAKINNKDMKVGKLALDIQEFAAAITALKVSENTGFHKKLQGILIAYNMGLFVRGSVKDNIDALNMGTDEWHSKLKNSPTEATDPLNIKFDEKFKAALVRYCHWRQQLLDRSKNDFATTVATSIGIMSVLMIEFLTNGELSEEKVEKLVFKSDLQHFVGLGKNHVALWDIFKDSFEEVSSTRKKLQATIRDYENIVKVLSRHFIDRVPQGVKAY